MRYFILEGDDVVDSKTTLEDATGLARSIARSITEEYLTLADDGESPTVRIAEVINEWTMLEDEMVQTHPTGCAMEELREENEELRAMFDRLQTDESTYRLGVEQGLKAAVEMLRELALARRLAGKSWRREMAAALCVRRAIMESME